MRKLWLWSALLVCFCSADLIACDICNIYLGIRPNDHRSYAGLFYRYRLLEGTATFSANGTILGSSKSRLKHGADGHVVNGPGNAVERKVALQERYEVMALRGRFFFKDPRWNLFVSLPVKRNGWYSSEGSDGSFTGIGDPLILMNYQLFSSEENEKGRGHRLSLGAGMEFPLARVDRQNALGEELHRDIQAGSGSWDPVLSLEYWVRWQRTGLNSVLTYKANTNGPGEYRFGDAINLDLQWFWLFELSEEFRIMPSLGSYFERAMPDVQKGDALSETGGKVLFGTLGTELFWKRFSLQGGFQLPLLDGLNDPVLANQHRWMCGLRYYF